MFVLCMNSPTGFPVCMAICGSMSQALESMKMSGNVWSIGKETDVYCEGYITVEGKSYEWSIV